MQIYTFTNKTQEIEFKEGFLSALKAYTLIRTLMIP